MSTSKRVHPELTTLKAAILATQVGARTEAKELMHLSWDNTAKLWDGATPVELAPQVKEARGGTATAGSSVSTANLLLQQVQSLSIIASGLEFSEEGSLVAVNEEHRSKLTKQLKDLCFHNRNTSPLIRLFVAWKKIQLNLREPERIMAEDGGHVITLFLSYICKWLIINNLEARGIIWQHRCV